MQTQTPPLPKSFEQLIRQSEKPILVDFWAEWCGPCRMVSPAIQRIAGEFKGSLLVIKVNVDEKPHIASQYQIQSIPTIMMFHRGQVTMRQTGALPYEMLRQEVEKKLMSVQ
ncbi:thioredoxin [candidate division KSB1 bacterium]|nr:thioredoxin [candidate division KSB1 bacterium]